MSYVRQAVAVSGVVVAKTEGMASSMHRSLFEDRLAEDCGADFYSVRIRCMLKFCWTAEPILDDVRRRKVQAHVPDRWPTPSSSL
jgi:hypothetical protein